MYSRLTILVVCVLAACSPRADASKEQKQPPLTTTTDRSARFDALIHQLETLEGEFTPEWEFAGDDAIFTRIGSLSDSGAVADTAVSQLASCIGRTGPAQAKFRGRAVPLGVVCYAALGHLAYA